MKIMRLIQLINSQGEVTIRFTQPFYCHVFSTIVWLRQATQMMRNKTNQGKTMTDLEVHKIISLDQLYSEESGLLVFSICKLVQWLDSCPGVRSG